VSFGGKPRLAENICGSAVQLGAGPTSESVDTGLRRLTTPRYVSKRVCWHRNRSFAAFMLLGLLVGLCWQVVLVGLFTIYVDNGIKYREYRALGDF
jgi:hypothetical protein